ncbi:MAG TPA: YbaB/EbfC family nucleoid-associated protein [Candidatus Gracilibacteria bacterium]|nr:YbaB/EbfC family nucleoid-associated protein [Candidatus Gracilibacteria bacterium]
MFDKIKDLYSLQKKAKQIKKDLKNIHIEAEVDGVIVIMDGEQEIVKLTIPENLANNISKLEDIIAKAFNKALKKSQEIAAEKMKDVMGPMGFPGLGQ